MSPRKTTPHPSSTAPATPATPPSRVKVLNAQAHGAVAVLIVAEPNRKHPSNQERVARIGGSITRAAPLPRKRSSDDKLHTPAATISDAVAKDLFAAAGSTRRRLQTAIDSYSASPNPARCPTPRVTLHYRNSSEPAPAHLRTSPACSKAATRRSRRNHPHQRPSRSRRHERRLKSGTAPTITAPARSASSRWRTPSPPTLARLPSPSARSCSWCSPPKSAAC